jgi:hypothetical protein
MILKVIVWVLCIARVELDPVSRWLASSACTQSRCETWTSSPILGMMGLKAIDSGTGAEGACRSGTVGNTNGVVPLVTTGGTAGSFVGT